VYRVGGAAHGTAPRTRHSGSPRRYAHEFLSCQHAIDRSHLSPFEGPFALPCVVSKFVHHEVELGNIQSSSVQETTKDEAEASEAADAEAETETRVAFAMATVAAAQAGEWEVHAEAAALGCRVGTALHCSG
jgi:2-keto-4-pentenoate hydratase/2-oxohepta-3-ene-1,7-dioic acid hydratase in catechol pathway